jgi:hypothetical protein
MTEAENRDDATGAAALGSPVSPHTPGRQVLGR